jgi:hypothetical protein
MLRDDAIVALYSVLEGKGWGLQCGAIFCVVRQRIGTAMWRFILCCKAKNGNCIVALFLCWKANDGQSEG